jgi:hypothetical protein
VPDDDAISSDDLDLLRGGSSEAPPVKKVAASVKATGVLSTYVSAILVVFQLCCNKNEDKSNTQITNYINIHLKISVRPVVSVEVEEI